MTFTVGRVVVVACCGIDAVVDVVTNQITIHIEEAMAIADAKNVNHANAWVFFVTNAVLVKVAIRTWIFTIYNSVVVAVVRAIVTCFFIVAGAVLVHIQAVVLIVTDAVGIRIRDAVTTTNTNGVELAAIAIAITDRNVRTSAFVNGPRTVANATFVHSAKAFLLVVTNAISIGVLEAITSTYPQSVDHISVAIALAFANAITVAHATFIVCTDTIVFVVADAVAVCVCRTISTALTEGVELVSVTVAIAFCNAVATAVAGRTGTVADAALVVFAYALVNVVANAIGISVC